MKSVFKPEARAPQSRIPHVPELLIPEDGMRITRDATLAPGVHYLPRGIEIDADGVTLDGNGAVLVGADFYGRGVTCRQRTGVTIRNLQVERYEHGLWLQACANIRLTANRITRTREIADTSVFLDVWRDERDAYGGGIYLNGVIDSVLEHNDVQHQQNGILLYGCDHVAVLGNNASFNSGFGIGLFGSSDNTIDNNTADFCCRVYQITKESVLTERYHNGADAAGLVLMGSSSRNTITHNRLRGGGDGVFLGGFHKDLIRMPCNDNLFEDNDGSWSPNIAFEATFSARNVFRNNRADACNYGFWLGYSSETTVEGNSIKDNRIAGVAIEHGHHNTIRGNTFERNRDGAQFWVNAQPAFLDHYPECAESGDTQVTGNTFARNDAAVRIWSGREEGGPPVAPRCHHFTVTGNTLRDNRIAALLERVRDSTVYDNHIAANVEAGIKLVGCRGVNTDGNRWG